MQDEDKTGQSNQNQVGNKIKDSMDLQVATSKFSETQDQDKSSFLTNFSLESLKKSLNSIESELQNSCLIQQIEYSTEDLEEIENTKDSQVSNENPKPHAKNHKQRGQCELRCRGCKKYFPTIYLQYCHNCSQKYCPQCLDIGENMFYSLESFKDTKVCDYCQDDLVKKQLSRQQYLKYLENKEKISKCKNQLTETKKLVKDLTAETEILHTEFDVNEYNSKKQKDYFALQINEIKQLELQRMEKVVLDQEKLQNLLKEIKVIGQKIQQLQQNIQNKKNEILELNFQKSELDLKIDLKSKSNNKLDMKFQMQNKMAFDPEDYAPKRFGLRFFPPVIVLEYLVPSSGKLYHHRMKIKDLEQETESIVSQIKKKHFKYINHPKIEDSQLVSLVKCLKEKHAQDLNKLSPEEVRKIKHQMDDQFKINQITPDNPEFVYDKRKKFQPTEVCDWDESEDIIL